MGMPERTGRDKRRPCSWCPSPAVIVDDKGQGACGNQKHLALLECKDAGE